MQNLQYLGFPPKIVETVASDAGFGGILKQKVRNQGKLVRFHSGSWNQNQIKYSTKKKKIDLVLCILKFQDDLINQEFFNAS